MDYSELLGNSTLETRRAATCILCLMHFTLITKLQQSIMAFLYVITCLALSFELLFSSSALADIWTRYIYYQTQKTVNSRNVSGILGELKTGRSQSDGR